VHIGHEAPSAPVSGGTEEAGSTRPGSWHLRRSRLQGSSIDWQRHGVEPRWLGMETGDCAAAINPVIFQNRGGTELGRFLTGAKARIASSCRDRVGVGS
jgi:hypothetical protein